MKQLAADCSLMQELRVMDYSLLLGVHYRSPGYSSSPQVTDKVPNRVLGHAHTPRVITRSIIDSPGVSCMQGLCKG